MGKVGKRALSQKPSAPDFKTYIFGNVLQFPIDWLKRIFFWQGRSSGPICHRIVSLSMETEGVPETSMDGIIIKEGQRSNSEHLHLHLDVACPYWRILVFLSNTKIISKSSDPFPLTGWVSGNRSELSLKCPFVNMSVSNFFYWTEILFKEFCSPLLNVFVEISIWVRRDGNDSWFRVF